MRLLLIVLFVLYGAALSVGLARRGVRSGNWRANGAERPRPVRILVIGATGGTGGHLVRQALERGCEVTALVRDPARLGLEHPRLTVVRGDVLDPASIDAAMTGQEAVACALGHRRYLGPSRILSEGTRNLVRAMTAHGARRIVCETSLGIGDSAGRMGLWYTLFVIPVILPFYFWDKTRQERALEESSVEWIVVRPAALTHGARRGRVRHGRRVGSFLWTTSVSRADVAGFMLDQLESDADLRTAVGVTGSRSGSPGE